MISSLGVLVCAASAVSEISFFGPPVFDEKRRNSGAFGDVFMREILRIGCARRGQAGWRIGPPSMCHRQSDPVRMMGGGWRRLPTLLLLLSSLSLCLYYDKQRKSLHPPPSFRARRGARTRASHAPER